MRQITYGVLCYMNKLEYRKYYKNIRNSIHKEIANKKSDMITDNLLSIKDFRNADRVFVYLSYGSEVSTDKIINYLLDNDKCVLVPKCNIENETMIPIRIHNLSDLQKGCYGIREPIISEEYKGKIDLAVIPGIAFDRYGNRIGHGKGYYDKFLENKTICKIALCYEECLSENRIPVSSYDLPMNYIVTDREVLSFDY